MNKLLKKLEVNTEDNWFKAFGKGALKGYVVGLGSIGLIVGTLIVIGKCTTNKEELKKFEEKIGA